MCRGSLDCDNVDLGFQCVNLGILRAVHFGTRLKSAKLKIFRRATVHNRYTFIDIFYKTIHLKISTNLCLLVDRIFDQIKRITQEAHTMLIRRSIIMLLKYQMKDPARLLLLKVNQSFQTIFSRQRNKRLNHDMIAANLQGRSEGPIKQAVLNIPMNQNDICFWKK